MKDNDDNFVDIDTSSNDQPMQMNQFTISSNKRYSAGNLYAATANHLLEKGWNATKIESFSQKDHNTYDASTRMLFTTDNELGKQVITPPATDRPESGLQFDPLSGKNVAYSILDAINDGKRAIGDGKSGSISIKVAQDRPMFKVFGFEFGPKRAHWTHLQINIKDDQISAIHTDSKNKLGKIYSLDAIRGALKEAFGKDIKLETKYTGKQGLRDDSNCGRFAAAHEFGVCTGEQKALDTPLEYANKTMKIDEKCNTYDTKLTELQSTYAAIPTVDVTQSVQQVQQVDVYKIAQHIREQCCVNQQAMAIPCATPSQMRGNEHKMNITL